MLLARGKSRHVGVVQDVRAVLVEPGVRHRESGLVQERRPADPLREPRVGLGRRLLVESDGHRGNALRVLAIDPVARDELLDGRFADVAAHRAPEEIVEDAQAQGPANRIDALDVELDQRRGHDREPGREHRRALGLQCDKLQTPDVSRADHPLAQAREALARDAGRREPVLLEDFGERQGGSRRCVRVVPVLAAELARDGLDFGARRRVGRGERGGRQGAVGKIPPRHSDATHLEGLEALGLEAATDDEFGRSAADVDDEPRLASTRGSTCATPL